MNSIQFTKESFFDLLDIVTWYEDQRKGLSHDFELCLEVAISEIQRAPSGYQKRYKNVMIKFINRFPYGVHYFIHENIITILGIFHTSRAPKNWKSRKPL